MAEGVQVQGPDGQTYSFPEGTTKDSAIAYFKKKGIAGPTHDSRTERERLVDALQSAQKKSPDSMSPYHEPSFFSKEGLKNLWHKTVDKGTNALPSIGGAGGAIAGGIAGGAPSGGIGAGPGAVVGATLGGGAGESAKQLMRRALLPTEEQMLSRMSPEQANVYRLRRQIEQFDKGRPVTEDRRPGVPQSSGEAALSILKEGGKQGAMEATGQIGGRVVGRVASAVKADNAMSRILGVSAKHLKDAQVGERSMPKMFTKVGRLVNKEVSKGASLEQLAANISKTKELYNQQIEQAVSTQGGKLSNLHSMIKNAVYIATKHMNAEGNVAGSKAIAKMANELRAQYPEFVSPQKLLEFQRLMKNEEFWVKKGYGPLGFFRETIGGEAKSAITKALPASAASQFSTASSKVHKLIIAEQALAERQLARKMGQEGVIESMGHSGVMASAAKSAAKSYPAQLTRLRARQAIEKAGPGVQKIIQNTPQLERLYETLTSPADAKGISYPQYSNQP